MSNQTKTLNSANQTVDATGLLVGVRYQVTVRSSDGQNREVTLSNKVKGVAKTVLQASQISLPMILEIENDAEGADEGKITCKAVEEIPAGESIYVNFTVSS